MISSSLKRKHTNPKIKITVWYNNVLEYQITNYILSSITAFYTVIIILIFTIYHLAFFMLLPFV